MASFFVASPKNTLRRSSCCPDARSLARACLIGLGGGRGCHTMPCCDGTESSSRRCAIKNRVKGSRLRVSGFQSVRGGEEDWRAARLPWPNCSTPRQRHFQDRQGQARVTYSNDIDVLLPSQVLLALLMPLCAGQSAKSALERNPASAYFSRQRATQWQQ
jgi:hypothetical protein